MKNTRRMISALILVLSALMPEAHLSAQELRVERVLQLPTDLSASVKSRSDNNGRPCALVKVAFAQTGAEFEGNVIGPVEEKAGEYWVYMSEGTKFLKLKHSDYAPLMIRFAESKVAGPSSSELAYDLVGPLVSKTTYMVRIGGLRAELAGTQKETVSFRVIPSEAILTVDGEMYEVSNGSIDIMLSAGEYSYTAMARGYELQTRKFTVYENYANKQTIVLDQRDGPVSPVSATPAIAAAAPAQLSAAELERQRILDMFEMVYVEGGTFSMGALPNDSDAYNSEKPSHSVTLSSYYIGKYEVTQKQWEMIMGSNPSRFKGDDLPVECVSWKKVQEFIRRLNEKTGKTYRLPTEAEWEYAARGGRHGDDSLYSGGNDIDAVAWYSDNSGGRTRPVGTKSPNALGIYDMSGNVWEWCSDRYGRYSSMSETNPQGPSKGDCRVIRGGCFGNKARFCRVSCRSYRDSWTNDFVGFRLALSL